MTGVLSLVFILKFTKWGRTRWIQTNQDLCNDQANASNTVAEEERFCIDCRQIPELLFFSMFTLCFIICNMLGYILRKQPVDEHKSDIVIACLSYTSYICVLIVFLVFIVRYNNVVIQQCTMFNYSLIAFTCFTTYYWFWLTFTCNSALDLFRHHCNGEDFKVAKNSTIKVVLGDVENFLEPFALEFFTISTATLIKLWNTMFEKLKIAEPNEVEDNTNRNKDTTIAIIPTTDSIDNTFRNCIFIILSLFVAISYTASYIILSNHFEQNRETKLSGEVYIWEGIKFGLYLPQCVLIFCSWKLSSLQNRRWLRFQATKDYFFFGLSIAVYFYGTLRIICALALLIYFDDLPNLEYRPSHGEIVAVFSFALFGIFQVYVQSYYLMIMQKHQTNLGNIHRCILAYTGSLNIAEWFILSLGHVWSAESKDNLFPLFTYVFGDFTTELIKVLFFPLITFYNFHCAILVYEILNNAINKYLYILFRVVLMQ